MRMDISDDRRSIADLTLKVNIVSYEGHYIGETLGFCYISLERYTIADCISQHNYKSSSAFIKNFVIATLMGLDHIFARWRMIHRDIKPGNIIKGKDGNWKITDFGTATVIGEDMSPAGTKELRAPEILNTENVMKDTSHQLKVDVFSLLGTILLAMKIRDFYERSKEFGTVREDS